MVKFVKKREMTSALQVILSGLHFPGLDGENS